MNTLNSSTQATGIPRSKFCRLTYLVPEDGLEPSRGLAPRDFKSLVSTDSTTQAPADPHDQDNNFLDRFQPITIVSGKHSLAVFGKRSSWLR